MNMPLWFLCLSCAVSHPSHGTSTKEKTVVASAVKRIRKLPHRTNSIGISLVRLPGGDFSMGDKNIPDARPVHLVRLSAFWIGQYEITNLQYETFFKKHQRNAESLSDKQPAIDVSWESATQFCEWLSNKEKRRYRLPTEAEWEYAARGGLVQKRYPWGNESWDDRATFGRLQTTPVGSWAPNGFGLYDMAGNAEEWVSDRYDDSYYARSPLKDPKGPLKSLLANDVTSKTKWKIARGRDFMGQEGENSVRNIWPLDLKAAGTGFRVVVEVDKSDKTAAN